MENKFHLCTIKPAASKLQFTRIHYDLISYSNWEQENTKYLVHLENKV